MALRVEQILYEKNVPFRLLILCEKAMSVDDVIKYSKEDIKREEICKTIIVKDKGGSAHAFLLKGDRKLDFSKVKEILGAVRMARADEVYEAAGTEPGAVCPFLLNVPLSVDKNVFETSRINFGSGDHMHGVEIATEDLGKVVKFDIVDVSQ